MRDFTTDGLLLVDKPAGVTSHDVVLAARRAFGESRIGHAGTLDPFATGVLLLLIGKATKLCEKLMDEPKQYEATIKFGASTSTDDLESPEQPYEVLEIPAMDRVESTLARFVG